MMYKYVLILKDLENVKEHRRKRQSLSATVVSLLWILQTFHRFMFLSVFGNRTFSEFVFKSM